VITGIRFHTAGVAGSIPASPTIFSTFILLWWLLALGSYLGSLGAFLDADANLIAAGLARTFRLSDLLPSISAGGATADAHRHHGRQRLQ